MVKICEKCGENNDDENGFCISCGAELPEINVETPIKEEDVIEGEIVESTTEEDEVLEEPVIPEESETKYCSNCGSEIDINAEICPKCGVRVEPATVNNVYSSPKSEKSQGLAAVLSFLICGVGQIYNGQIGKGIGLLIAVIICGFLSILIVPAIIAIILWIYGIYDAYDTAGKINRGEIIV